jgi:hypothetical protein
VVVLAGDDAPLRLWIEQVGSRLSFEQAGKQVTIPLLLAGAEGTRPAALPYLNATSSRVQGAVFGLAGAQEIENRLIEGRLTGTAATPARSRLGLMMHTQSAALFFLALALLVGFVAGAYRWINRRGAA